jgi:biotin-dependent enzyme
MLPGVETPGFMPVPLRGVEAMKLMNEIESDVDGVVEA